MELTSINIDQMGNQYLLDSQLETLGEVTREISLSKIDHHVRSIKRKRADIVRSTYADLGVQARYQKAIQFLASDLLGDNSLSARGGELARAKSAMVKTMPDALLGAVARSVEFTVTTLEIELAAARRLNDMDIADNSISDKTYFSCIQSAVARDKLGLQSSLVVMVGEEIESVVNRPFVTTALKICRRPAKLMGLGELQNFLERGFDAFRAMRGSQEFLKVFHERETELIDQIYKTKSC